MKLMAVISRGPSIGCKGVAPERGKKMSERNVRKVSITKGRRKEVRGVTWERQVTDLVVYDEVLCVLEDSNTILYS